MPYRRRLHHPRLHARCRVCGLGFSAAAWDARYTDLQGDTCHDRCRIDPAGRAALRWRRLAALEASMQEFTL